MLKCVVKNKKKIKTLKFFIFIFFSTFSFFLTQHTILYSNKLLLKFYSCYCKKSCSDYQNILSALDKKHNYELGFGSFFYFFLNVQNSDSREQMSRIWIPGPVSSAGGVAGQYQQQSQLKEWQHSVSAVDDCDTHCQRTRFRLA